MRRIFVYVDPESFPRGAGLHLYTLSEEDAALTAEMYTQDGHSVIYFFADICASDVD